MDEHHETPYCAVSPSSRHMYGQSNAPRIPPFILGVPISELRQLVCQSLSRLRCSFRKRNITIDHIRYISLSSFRETGQYTGQLGVQFTVHFRESVQVGVQFGVPSRESVQLGVQFGVPFRESLQLGV